MQYLSIGATTMLSPLPCVLVSCRGREGRANLITLAWTGIVCTRPPMVSISVKPSRFSYGLIEETQEFCLHPADREHVRALDLCGVKSGRDVDKFALTGQKEMDAGLEFAPGLEGMPLCLPCRVEQKISLGSHDLFIAQIQKVLVRPDLADETGAIHLERANLVAYSHGLYQQLGPVLGFFGFSVARKDTLKKRMTQYGSSREQLQKQDAAHPDTTSGNPPGESRT